MSTYETVLAEASQLTEWERGQLIDALWETLPEASLPPLSDEWREEIARRSADLEAGRVTTVPWEQVREEALGRLSSSPKPTTH
jgi:putative addiction module component (TIGR02574 family)